MIFASARRAILIAFGAITVALFGGSADASILDRVKFSQAPMVIVWQDDVGPARDNQITLAQPDRPVYAPVSTFAGGGLLEPVTLETVGYAPAQQQKQFHVASNAAFSIRAQSGENRWTTGGNRTFQVEIVGIGENAQAPGPSSSAVYDMADLSTPKTVYQASRRTAASRGDVKSQSVTFEAQWSGDTSTDITLTVFIP